MVVFKEMNIMNSFTLESSFFGKEWSPQQDSIDMNNPFHKFLNGKKKKINQLSLTDYNKLGETMMQVMNNYLPSEQSKL